MATELKIRPEKRYSDFTTSFAIHPVTGDLGIVEDVDSIRRSVRNLVMTNKRERLLKPRIGSNVRRLLFENISPRVSMMLQDYIRETIENHEPRATIVRINVQPDYLNGAYTVDIEFSVTFLENPIRLQFFLERIR